mmetsp:Transcript_64165/g.165176  ORF Transcript_64165/g.165176 Transcript_64165/m.165176 type:complete len:223 (-) Transcript_64165:367-1035(-)
MGIARSIRLDAKSLHPPDQPELDVCVPLARDRIHGDLVAGHVGQNAFLPHLVQDGERLGVPPQLGVHPQQAVEAQAAGDDAAPFHLVEQVRGLRPEASVLVRVEELLKGRGIWLDLLLRGTEQLHGPPREAFEPERPQRERKMRAVGKPVALAQRLSFVLTSVLGTSHHRHKGRQSRLVGWTQIPRLRLVACCLRVALSHRLHVNLLFLAFFLLPREVVLIA